VGDYHYHCRTRTDHHWRQGQSAQYRKRHHRSSVGVRPGYGRDGCNINAAGWRLYWLAWQGGSVMPLTRKGRKIKAAMEREYGKKKGDQVFYASENKGTIDVKAHRHLFGRKRHA
jgi:hypothetical protein